MNGKVVKITGLLLVICLLLLGYEVFQYYQLPEKSREKEIQIVDDKIKNISQKKEEKEKEKQSLEEEKAWKIEVYQTWEKEVNY